MGAERLVEKNMTGEQIAAAFSDPTSKGELVPYGPGQTQITATDGIITAQKVAVERDLAKIMKNIKIMASAAGEDWYYRFPVKKKDGATDWIEGPSIKCANNVARLYGNCQVDTRIVDNGDSWLIYARFVDYETGFSYTRPFQQRRNQRTMGTDIDRQLDIALQIGVSKAIRNVVCNALETFATFGFEEARQNIVEKVGKKLDEYRSRVIGRLADLKVDIKRVETAMGRAAKDWLAHDVAKIIAELQAIQDGMATVDEVWPGEAPPAPRREDFKEAVVEETKAPAEAPKREAKTPPDATFGLPGTDGNGTVQERPSEEAVKAEAEANTAIAEVDKLTTAKGVDDWLARKKDMLAKIHAVNPDAAQAVVSSADYRKRQIVGAAA